MAEKKGKKMRTITASSKSYYSLQRGRTLDNQIKKLKRHIRHHPGDSANYNRLVELSGKEYNVTCSKGWKLIRRAKKRIEVSSFYATLANEKIRELQQHNARQQEVQGPLYSEYGFRAALQEIRHARSKAINGS